MVRMALLKQGPFRSYDELLMLKSHLSKSDFIKNTLSSSLLPKQVDELCRSLLLEHFSAGEFVFRQNDPGDKMYIILSGSCEVRKKEKVDLAHGASETREKVLFVVQPGQHFGERALSEDLPRAASIACVEDTDLISISKRIYNLLLKSAHVDASSMGGMTDQPGTKPFILKVLSKRRETRSPLEIESVAGYLNWRIPFFQKFTQDQQLELCRVSEVITIWGKTILFKQGSIGQAFYVILTGSVEIWVLKGDQKEQLQARMVAAASASAGSSSAIDETLLGDKVATLNVGEIFGERALENADSLRMASIVTCDQQTELLVISREDYHKLVSALMNKEIMSKINCLRKTSVFKNTEMIYLKELARYMEPRRFELDEVLYRAGSKATEMVVIDCGECVVEVSMETYTEDVTTEISGITVTKSGTRGKRKMIEVGRIAPHSVLAPYVTQVEHLHDTVFHPETVTANTLVLSYTVSQHDFYTHMSREARQAIADLIKNHKSHLLTALWDDSPISLGEEQYRVQKAWQMYRENLLLPSAERKELTYSEALKALSTMHITHDSGNAMKTSSGAKIMSKTRSDGSQVIGTTSFSMKNTSGTSPFVPTDSSIQLEEQEPEGPPIVDINWGIPSPKKGINYLDGLTKDISVVNPTVLRVIRNGEANSKKLGHQGAAAAPAHDPETSAKQPTPRFLRLGFSLVHVHRETLRADPTNVGARRLLRAYMRLCGTMHSCTDAKDVAEALMKNALHVLYNCDLSRKHELQLKWKSYGGLESMPLHNTDIFLVYCRSVPVEYACISPSEDFLCNFDYPASCKQKHQLFACMRMKKLSSEQIQTRSHSSRASSRGAKSVTGLSSSFKPTSGISTVINVKKAAEKLKLGGRNRHARHEESDDSDDEMLPDKEAELERAGLPIGSDEKQLDAMEKLLHPIYTVELGAYVEVMATAATRVECLRYHLASMAETSQAVTTGHFPRSVSISSNIGQIARGASEGKVSRPNNAVTVAAAAAAAAAPDIRTCIIPLYEWFHISDERAKALDIDFISLSSTEMSALGAGTILPPPPLTGAVHQIRVAAVTASVRGTRAGNKAELMESFGEMGLRHQSKSRFTESKCFSPDPLPELKVHILGEEAACRELSLSVKKNRDTTERERRERERELERQLKEERRRRRKPGIPGAPRSPQGGTGGVGSEGSIMSSTFSATDGANSLMLPDVMQQDSTVSAQSSTASGTEAGNRFVVTAEKIKAMQLVLEKRREIFALNDRLCSDESDISNLARAMRKGLGTRLKSEAEDDSDGEIDEGGGAATTTTATTKLQKVRDISEEEKEELRKKRQNARRGLWESKQTSPGMGLLNQRMQVYDKLVSLPTRGELQIQLEGSGSLASAAPTSIPSAERGSGGTSTMSSISAIKGPTAAATRGGGVGTARYSAPKFLSTRLDTVHSMLATSNF